MSTDYSPPLVSNELGRHSLEAAADRNLYARGTHAAWLGEIDGVAVRELVKQFGSPLFVFSEATIRRQARRMREAFTSRHPDTVFAWSYKTNYLGAICRVLHEEGWTAEVVSDFEYQKARKLGIAGEDIVYNGPYKPRASLETAVREHALIQIDNWDELTLVEELASGLPQPLDVGIRVWLDAGIQPVWSKFGFALENGEAARAAAQVLAHPKLRLHTLHTHIGTYILAPGAYAVALAKLLALRSQIRQEHGHQVPCINLGGGFPSLSLLHGMPGPAEAVVPPIEAYAAAIAGVLEKVPARARPQLRLESGRYLVDEAGYLLASVVAVKGVRDPFAAGDSAARAYKEQMLAGDDVRTSYVIDAGINLLYTAAWYRMDILPTHPGRTPPAPTRLYGPLCMAIDVVRYTVDLPPLELGDVLTLHPVGAYNVVQSMQFIAYRPAVVMIGTSGQPVLIRARETLDDVAGPERMPAHLQQG
ncbi:MAG TPA: alanine racemase [Ramlibacter sp.]|uniref:alanine racemase n=1 Tax=Ramlibacter sp. TaxID=1917967 RepID=UPI002D7F4C10|nr:alanine racemase [Ramlibacter sp.]HET8746388.1 alanine racemase [Ramlibacter sp.]